jgi:hypothetical protein
MRAEDEVKPFGEREWLSDVCVDGRTRRVQIDRLVARNPSAQPVSQASLRGDVKHRLELLCLEIAPQQPLALYRAASIAAGGAPWAAGSKEPTGAMAADAAMA